MQLRRAILFVKDMPRMTAFYRDALAMRVASGSPEEGWVELDAGGSGLALHAIPPEVASKIEIADPPAARSDVPVKLVFETADVAAARDHLVRHGAVAREPRPWGACDCVDPEGNVFQIVPREPHPAAS